ncbi:MAG: hypothetical protein WCK89_00095 [bacterium]
MNGCPTCKRALPEEVAECPRCGCDLSTLQAGQCAARRGFAAGTRALREERFDVARAAFGRAWRWRHDASSARGRAVAALGLGCYAEAIRYREQGYDNFRGGAKGPAACPAGIS